MSRETAVQKYLRRKAELAESLITTQRPHCFRCHKPEVTCYCPTLKAIESDTRIVVLMHPLEYKHPVGTGRMTHQCLANSELIVGVDFTKDARVNEILNDPTLAPMVLFPGPKSTDISNLPASQRREMIPEGKTPVIFVIDGTWLLAKKMLHRSPNLQAIPRLCFVPNRPSRFLIRKQPHANCFSTIESIHELLGLLDAEGESNDPKDYDILMHAFDAMVAKQLSFKKAGPSRHFLNYEARKARKLRKQQLKRPPEQETT